MVLTKSRLTCSWSCFYYSFSNSLQKALSYLPALWVDYSHPLSLIHHLQERRTVSPLWRSIVIIKTPQFEPNLGSAHLWGFFVAHDPPCPSVQQRFFSVSGWVQRTPPSHHFQATGGFGLNIQLSGIALSYTQPHMHTQIRRGPACWKYFI